MAYIDEHRGRVVEGRPLGVGPIIEVLRDADVEIAPSSYYAAKARAPCARAIRDAELVPAIRDAELVPAIRDAELVPAIREVHVDNIGVYGSRKVWSGLSSTARATRSRVAPSCG